MPGEALRPVLLQLVTLRPKLCSALRSVLPHVGLRQGAAQHVPEALAACVGSNRFAQQSVSPEARNLRRLQYNCTGCTGGTLTNTPWLSRTNTFPSVSYLQALTG